MRKTIITVKRKAYCRKGFTTKKGVKQPPVCMSPTAYKKKTFYPRGKKVIPPLKKGTLGIKLKSSMETLKRQVIERAKELGEKRVGGKLRALAILFKRSHPEYSKKAGELASYVFGSQIKKETVGYPYGFRSKSRQLKAII